MVLILQILVLILKCVKILTLINHNFRQILTFRPKFGQILKLKNPNDEKLCPSNRNFDQKKWHFLTIEIKIAPIMTHSTNSGARHQRLGKYTASLCKQKHGRIIENVYVEIDSGGLWEDGIFVDIKNVLQAQQMSTILPRLQRQHLHVRWQRFQQSPFLICKNISYQDIWMKQFHPKSISKRLVYIYYDLVFIIVIIIVYRIFIKKKTFKLNRWTKTNR